MDKGGNFIGWLYIDGVNLSVSLVEEGFAKVHFTAERSSHFKALQHAETKAKESKLNVSIGIQQQLLLLLLLLLLILSFLTTIFPVQPGLAG